jgi:hypothetical protein
MGEGVANAPSPYYHVYIHHNHGAPVTINVNIELDLADDITIKNLQRTKEIMEAQLSGLSGDMQRFPWLFSCEPSEEAREIEKYLAAFNTVIEYFTPPKLEY